MGGCHLQRYVMTTKKILIIDDEKDICQMLAMALKVNEYDADYATTLERGMEKAKMEKPDMLILDINLPDGSGLDHIPVFKESFPGIKIIMNSAYDGQEERLQAQENGADYFVAKPLNTKEILDAIGEVDKTHKSDKEY